MRYRRGSSPKRPKDKLSMLISLSSTKAVLLGRQKLPRFSARGNCRIQVYTFRIYLHNLLISWEISRFRISHQQQQQEQEVIIINDEKLSTKIEEENEIQRSIRLLTINFDIVEDKPRRRCTYLDLKKRTEIEKFDTFSFFVYTVDCEALVPDIRKFPRRFWALNQFSVANCLGIGNQLSIENRPNRFVCQRWEVLNRLRHFSFAPKRPEKQSLGNRCECWELYMSFENTSVSGRSKSLDWISRSMGIEWWKKN